MAEEIWKDIKGYEGRYQASNTGKIRALNFWRTGQTRELKKIMHKNKKYGSVDIIDKNNIRHRYSVIRLIAETFIPNPHHYKNVRHISEDCLDDSVENIMWCNVSDYLKKLYKEKRTYNRRDYTIEYKGKKYKSKKELLKCYGIRQRLYYDRKKRGYTEEQAIETPINKVINIRKGKEYEYYNKNLTIKELSELHNIPEVLIRRRINELNWNVYEAAEITPADYSKRKKKESK